MRNVSLVRVLCCIMLMQGFLFFGCGDDVTQIPAPQPGGTPPVADAGSNLDAKPGEQVDLDGTGSHDTNGGSIQSYFWSQKFIVNSSSVTQLAEITLSDAPPVEIFGRTTATPHFTVPAGVAAGTVFSFGLEVTGNGGSHTWSNRFVLLV